MTRKVAVTLITLGLALLQPAPKISSHADQFPPIDECIAVTEIPANYEDYLPKPEPVEPMINYKAMSVPGNRNAFAYMPYTAITSKGSPQYQYRLKATTDSQGYRRIGDYYLVALGTYYGRTGDKFLITMDSGLVYKAIMGDVKSNAHTDSSNRVSGDGSIVEFIVDYQRFTRTELKQFRGSIVKIEKEL